MNNYILISRTYAETTPESVEVGEFSDTGFKDECEQVTFTQLVELMRDHFSASCSPNDGSIDVSYSTGFFTSDYRTGTNRQESIHYHQNNTPNCAKYWAWARKIAHAREKQRLQRIKETQQW